jgi:hypothetical protein
MLLKDSFKLYRMINDGIIRLIDMFFDMGRATGPVRSGQGPVK